MKSFKKAIKCIALVGAAAGTLTMVLKALSLHQRVNAHEEKAVFGGKQINYEVEPFEKDSVAAVFSGIKMDFTKAEMANDSAQLNVFGRFSGIAVKVPESWNVTMDGTSLQSGIVGDYTDNSEDENAPKLQINYDLKYSGLKVSNPKKEEEVLLIEDVVEEDDEIVEEEA